MKWIRNIAPWILLATYLPLVALSSTHVHHDTIDSQDNCLQCTGHFEAEHHHDNDCQYCQFLSLSYFGQFSGQSTIITPATEALPLSAYEPMVQLRYGVCSLRAPPSTMC